MHDGKNPNSLEGKRSMGLENDYGHENHSSFKTNNNMKSRLIGDNLRLIELLVKGLGEDWSEIEQPNELVQRINEFSNSRPVGDETRKRMSFNDAIKSIALETSTNDVFQIAKEYFQLRRIVETAGFDPGPDLLVELNLKTMRSEFKRDAKRLVEKGRKERQ